MNALLSERQKLLENRRCVICEMNDASVVLLPCGHLVYCASCSEKRFVCYKCFQKIGAEVNVFF